MAAIIHPDTRLGYVHLRVADLGRVLPFYRDLLGLQVAGRRDGVVGLTAPGSSCCLLVLEERRDAVPRPARTTGLYHFAILLPERPALAQALRRLLAAAVPLQGASDHGVSEAVYLADPEGNGVELYADRDRARWPRRGERLEMFTRPLDVPDLLAAEGDDPQPWQGMPAGACIGHVHLTGAALEPARAFYCDGLGFELVQRYGVQAIFLAAGGYHHHIGVNTWAGPGAPPPPPNATGLRGFSIVLPENAALAAVAERLAELGQPAAVTRTWDEQTARAARDPDGNRVWLTVGRF